MMKLHRTVLTVLALAAGISGSSPLPENNLNSEVLQPQPAANVYYYQHYPDSSGYYNNNNYNNNNPPAPYNQKQDLFGGSDNFNLLGGDQGGDIAGSIGGVVAAVAALLGLKGLTKLGAAALFIFIFVIIPLFIVPIVLSIAAIALSAVDNGGSGSGSTMDKIKDYFNRDKRAMSTFQSVLNSEDCIERISCSIGKRVFSDGYSRYVLRGTKSSSQAESEAKGNEGNSTEKPGFLTRVARGLKAENCVSYKCSIMPRFP
ncbi:unnamed protein product [Allacma fusca]|uniref:Uncharacterized protein n=1 Tax=Allacma fusca TaxID=39272 RepID=A0A8J2PN41_9HEXA|nr:unnamed protein product [Allacma fusca]